MTTCWPSQGLARPSFSPPSEMNYPASSGRVVPQAMPTAEVKAVEELRPEGVAHLLYQSRPAGADRRSRGRSLPVQSGAQMSYNQDMAPPDLTLIREFKRRAETALPGRVVRVLLYGSRARRRTAGLGLGRRRAPDRATVASGPQGAVRHRVRSDDGKRAASAACRRGCISFHRRVLFPQESY